MSCTQNMHHQQDRRCLESAAWDQMAAMPGEFRGIPFGHSPNIIITEDTTKGLHSEYREFQAGP